MSMLRQSSLNQLKRINDEIKKQGGDAGDRKSDSEKNFANSMWMHNPISADQEGKRKIATYDQMFSIDIPDADTTVKMKNENMKLNEGKVKQALQDAIDEYYLEDNGDAVDIISQLTGLNFDQVLTTLDISSQDNAMENLMEQDYTKNENKSMKNILSFEKMFENGPNDTPQEIMKNMKTIANWHSEDTPKKEMNQLLIGKYINTGKVKGYVQRIEGTVVFIDSIVEPLGLMKIKLKDAVKGYKPEKEKSESNMAIEGPNNKSLGSVPKTGGGFSPKLDAKGQVAADQKISNKINKEKSITKFSDMAIEFDSKTASTKNSPIAPKIDKKGTETKDSKTNKINFKDKKISKMDNLAEPMKTGKPSKSQNEPGATVDKKAEKASDNAITTKNTKIKKFSDMKSDVQSGPNKKK